MNAIYQTKSEERWDQIARKAYGDPTKISDIITANPGVAITDILPQGTRLLIPIKEATTNFVDILPPWRQ